jgi:ABC-type glutathione transport system ATPase component
VLPAQLSAGMSTRAALARALVSDPEFAVLDSFDEGTDPVRLGYLCELIRRRHEAQGGTYVIATHDMDVTRRLAHHVVVLWDGQVIEEGPTEQVFGSGLSEVRQFVTGATEGPLALQSARPALQGSAPAPVAPGETGMHIPIPLATAVTLIVVTATELVFGSGRPLELAVLVLAWVGAAVALAARHARPR